jgi:uncharacterized protein YceK
MKKISIIIFLMILGCAGAMPQQDLEDTYTDSRDNTCMKECAVSYWECKSNTNVGTGGGVLARQGVSDALYACRFSLDKCANNCPDG